MKITKSTKNNIIKGVLITVFAVIILNFGNFYVQSKVDTAIRIEKESNQNNLILENKILALQIQADYKTLESKLDSTNLLNTEEHIELRVSVDKLSTNVKNLIYVVEKNDESMRKDLQEIKKLQNPTNLVSN